MPTTDDSQRLKNFIDGQTRARALTMVGHGCIGIFLGLLMGYGLIFSVLERIEIWPFLSIDGQIPGSIGAWRAAHTGPIMNGLLCIAGAFALSVVPGGIFGNAHSLTGGTSEKFGEANLFDLMGFLPALIAAVITPACMFIVARAAFQSRTA